MLVLTRKSQQSIMIGDDVEVSVIAINGHSVRIGIRAPRAIPVYRNEIYAELQHTGPGASGSARAEVDRALARLNGASQSPFPAPT